MKSFGPSGEPLTGERRIQRTRQLEENASLKRIAARTGAASFPSNTLLKCSAADSELDELLATRTDETGTLSDDWRNRLIVAGDLLREELQKVYSSEVPTRSDSSGVALNASAIFAALRRLDIRMGSQLINSNLNGIVLDGAIKRSSKTWARSI